MLRFGMAAVAITLVPALLMAQTDSSRMRDSSRRAGRQEQTSPGTIGRSSRRNRLNHDQVTQLQTALQQMGCDPGNVDGVMGQHTQRAEACARQKNNITSNDPQALYQSLNLNFAASDTGVADSRGTRGAMRNDSTRARSGMRGARRGSGMRGDSTRMRTRSDSTRRPGRTTGRPDSTRRP